MNKDKLPLHRAQAFARRFGLSAPVLMAPMAGACPPGLARAVADAGGMGAIGALLDQPEAIAAWVADFRADTASPRPLQMNLWIPDPAPRRDAAHEQRVRQFLQQWGPQIDPMMVDGATVPHFERQCDALLAARPTAISSIMGLYPPAFVERMQQLGIAWFACVTTVEDARAAQRAGADVIVAQGAEAGGHRGAFVAAEGADRAAGLFALLPQVVDAVSLPVVATGGVADARGIAAALLLGASAVQIGSGLLRTDESSVPLAWRDAMAGCTPDGTRLTRAFSGRWGRALASDYVIDAAASGAPEPAPYPLQRALTAAMRTQAVRDDDISRMQAWCGQGAALSGAGSATDLVSQLWRGAEAMLDARPIEASVSAAEALIE